MDLFRLITGKTSRKITLTCRLHAASRYAQRSDIQTVENNVQDNKTTRLMPMMSQMIQQEPNVRACVTTHGRDRYSMTSHLRDRHMPAVVTASITIQQLVRSVRKGCAVVVYASGKREILIM